MTVELHCPLTYQGQPLWRLPLYRSTRARPFDRVLAVLTPDAGPAGSLLNLRIAHQPPTEPERPPAPLLPPPRLDLVWLSKRSQVTLGPSAEEIVARRGEHSGDVRLALHQGALRVQCQIQPQQLGSKLLDLRSDGIGLELTTTEWGTLSGLLTVDERGALIVRPLSGPALAADPWEPLLILSQAAARVRSPARWLDWAWSRQPGRDDLRLPVLPHASKAGLSRAEFEGVLATDAGLLRVRLRDQMPGDSLRPLSQLETGIAGLHLHSERATGSAARILTGIVWLDDAPPTARPPRLTYQLDPLRNESLVGERLALKVEPDLRMRLQEARDDGGEVRRVFLPIAQGWLQLPTPAPRSPANAGTPVKAAAAPSATPPSAIGWLEIGTRRPERTQEGAIADQMPWALRVERLAGCAGTVQVDAAGQVVRIDGQWHVPQLSLRGLLWAAVGRADDDDLLPRLGLGSNHLRDLVFRTGLPDGWSAALGTLTIRTSGTSEWPEFAWSELTLDLETELAAAGHGAEPIVAWHRHDRLPAIQIVPLTSAREAPTQALGSRELAPLRLSGQALTLRATSGQWPALLADLSHARFWWPLGAPASGGAPDWAEDPERKGDGSRELTLVSGMPLAALSLAGVEFWCRDGNPFAPALRLDLPHADEFLSQARLPRQPGADVEKVEPVRPVADLALGEDGAVQSLWLGRHDAWTLTLGRGSVLLDRNGKVAPQALLPGYAWNGQVQVDTSLPHIGWTLGSVSIRDGAVQQALAGAALLAGMTAGLDITGGVLSLSQQAGLPQMLGWALPALSLPSGALLDGNGLSSAPVHPGTLEQSVRWQGEEWLRITLKQVLAFQLAGASCAFWCRELPCRIRSGQAAFDRAAIGFAHDSPLAGYEWRLYRTAGRTDTLPLNPHLELEPLTLIQATRLTADRWQVVIEGWLRPRLDTAPRLGLARVTLSLSAAATAVEQLRVMDALTWPVPALALQDGRRVLSRDPWLRLEVDGRGITGAVLHIPVCGHWTALPLAAPAGGSGFTFQRTQALELGAGLSVPGARLTLTAQDASLDLKVRVVTTGFELEVQRTAVPVLPSVDMHTLTLLRFPGMPASGTIQPALPPGYNLLVDTGLALQWSASGGLTVEPLPGFIMLDTEHQWRLGLGFAESAGKPALHTAYLEGAITGRRDRDGSVRRLDLLLTADGAGTWQHQLRLLGDWSLDSLVLWQNATVTAKQVILHGDGLTHALTVHWQGQVLSGGILHVRDDGTLVPQLRETPALRVDHRISGQRTDGTECHLAVSTLERLFVGTLDSLLAEIEARATTRVANLHGDGQAAVVLSGFFGVTNGSHTAPIRDFRDALVQLRNAIAPSAQSPRLLLSSALSLVGGVPIVLATVVALDRTWPGMQGPVDVEARLRAALNKVPAESLRGVQSFDAVQQPLSGIRVGPVTMRQAPMATTTGMLTPSWRLGSLSLEPQFAIDDGLWAVHQQGHEDNGYYPDHPLLRAKLAVSRVLADHPKPACHGLALVAGETLAFTADDIQSNAAQPAAAFVAPLPVYDLVVAGAYGLQVIPAPAADAVDVDWLRQAISCRLGAPSFALRRSLAGQTPSAAYRVCEERLDANTEPALIAATPLPDSTHGWSRAPTTVADGTTLAAQLRSQLLGREPLEVSASSQACRGTRHRYALPSHAQVTAHHAAIWHAQLESVLFAAPRPAVVNSLALRAEWPARQLLPAPRAVPPSGPPTQRALHGFRESLHFAQRSGVQRLHREALLQRSGSAHDEPDAEIGLSLPHGFRAPRPLALPRARQCFSPTTTQRLDVVRGAADFGWVPIKVNTGEKSTLWQRKTARFVLVDPVDGIVGTGWNERFVLHIHRTNLPSDHPARLPDIALVNAVVGFDWRAQLLCADGSAVALETGLAASGNALLLKLPSGVARPAPQDELAGELQVQLVPRLAAPGSTSLAADLHLEPALSLSFPLLFVSGRRFALPMRRWTIGFIDPVYNAALGSEVAVQSLGKTEVLRLDRKAYAASGPLVLMVTDGDASQATVKFERWRRRPQSTELNIETLQLPGGVLQVPTGLPMRIELGQLALRGSAQQSGAQLRGGDLLRVHLTTRAGATLQLLVPIADEPVLPPPAAAYGLWRLEAGRAWQCPLYGCAVMPQRVELVHPLDDFEDGRVRRSALFRWSVVEPRWRTPARYFLQRIDAVGATHYPENDRDLVDAADPIHSENPP